MMSYTPDSQRLDGPLDEFLPSIKPVREAMLERLRHRHEWTEEHVVDLDGLVLEIQALEFKLIKLRQETR